MDNQTILFTCITLGSLAGWYVIISKYLALKASLKVKSQSKPKTEQQNEIPMSQNKTSEVQPVYMPDPFPETDYQPDEHIPGMGPPPLGGIPYRVPPEVIAALQQKQRMQEVAAQNRFSDEPVQGAPEEKPQKLNTNRKREICNYATIMHLSGCAFITGIPFLNIILPLILWLAKKEQHPFLAKQGREIINFQITFTLMLFMALGLGTLFIWAFPNAAANMLEWTRTLRVVFATSMYLPFNMFTAIPFFWGCIMVIRGAVAAYHGINYRYPYTQPFIFEGKALQSRNQTDAVIVRKEPELPQHEAASAPTFNRINFG